MPFSVSRACGHCGGTHRPRERCAVAVRREAKRKASFDRTRPGARRRGYDANWEREAKAFLALPGNQRCECGAKASLVRHRISIARRPDLRMVRANWRPGCPRCNALDAARERRALKG